LIQDELTYINEALTVHQTGQGLTVQLQPQLVHALLPMKPSDLVHQLLEALLLRLHLDECCSSGSTAPKPTVDKDQEESMLASPRKQTNAPDFGSVGFGFFLNSISDLSFISSIFFSLKSNT
jgi:hypothetical protein